MSFGRGFLHLKIDSVSMRSSRYTLYLKAKNTIYFIYICLLYTFTVSDALYILEGNGFRWKLTHKWIHCRRKLDLKINPSTIPSFMLPPHLFSTGTNFILFHSIRACNTSNTTWQSKHRSIDIFRKPIGYTSPGTF